MTENRPSKPSPALPRGAALAGALALCLALYAVDAACLAAVPAGAHAFTANFGVPFDLMVCVPLAFYLLVVRPRRITPFAVLPVVYLGAGISAALAAPGEPTLLPVLLTAAAGLDAAVFFVEGRRLVAAFKEARRTSDDPFAWFLAPALLIVKQDRVARSFALELTVWYYLAFSWRAKPRMREGMQAFTCYKENGFLALIGVVAALSPIEIVGVHIALSQWSPLAAAVLTALSVYTLFWIGGMARAVVLNPILVGGGHIAVRWAFAETERFPLSNIEGIGANEPDMPKKEKLDLGTLGANPCWITLREPVAARSALGSQRLVRAINVSPDDARAFRSACLK